MNKSHDTEGEKLIEFFLQEELLTYKKQVEIPKLQGDFASYRIADFYLPKYKVYIEFLGKWNSDEGKAKYLQKMEAYKNNKIPCVYLYPDNLGTLKYLFYMRLRDELEKYPELKFQLFKYKFSRSKKAVGTIWYYSLIMILLAIFGASKIPLNPDAVPYMLLMVLVVFLAALYFTYAAVKIIFFEK